MDKIKKFIPMLIGIVLMAAGVFFYFRAGELNKVCTEHTAATVVDMREEFHIDSDNVTRYSYYPVIEYQVNGQSITKELGSSTGSPAYRIGEQLEILYNPSKVDEFIVAGENQYLTCILLGALGLVFFGVGIYTIIKK